MSQSIPQVTNSNSKATSAVASSKQQVSSDKGNPQIQEEWVRSLVFYIENWDLLKVFFREVTKSKCNNNYNKLSLLFFLLNLFFFLFGFMYLN